MSLVRDTRRPSARRRAREMAHVALGAGFAVLLVGSAGTAAAMKPDLGSDPEAQKSFTRVPTQAGDVRKDTDWNARRKPPKPGRERATAVTQPAQPDPGRATGTSTHGACVDCVRKP